MYKIMFMMMMLGILPFTFFSNWSHSVTYTMCVESESGFHLAFGMHFWLPLDGPEIAWPVLARIWKYFNISYSCMILINFKIRIGEHRPVMDSESFRELRHRAWGFTSACSPPCSLPTSLGWPSALAASLCKCGSCAPSTPDINPSFRI